MAILFLTGFLTSGCTSGETQSSKIDWDSIQDSSHIVFTITNLDWPESVRYDAEQDVYFISNFSGAGNEENANGFITKADTEGNIITRKFMTGTEAAPLHAPRGMYIVNGTLWAADIWGVHGFDRKTGEQTDFIDFTEFEPGFLNDISADQDGNLYVTDTGSSKVYKVENNTVSVFLDSLDAAPNGITLNPETNEFILAPWNGKTTFFSFSTSQNVSDFGKLEGGFFDGLEFVENKLLVASQIDSSIRVFDGNSNRIFIKTNGVPADIGINTKLNHIAVPYIALDRVDVWSLTQ